jgi:cysteine-rich repeat protein
VARDARGSSIVTESRPEPRPPSEHDIRAAARDPEAAGLLCILCILGGNQQVCGEDNVTYGNKCWAACAEVDVVHTGACSCGDGYAGPGEACDDGNTIDNDGCRADCTPAVCGDGVVWNGHEACDDGNQDDTDACTACLHAECGDGVVT